MNFKSIYYWKIRILWGNHFKIGIYQKNMLNEINKGQSFSDNKYGWAYYSNG